MNNIRDFQEKYITMMESRFNIGKNQDILNEIRDGEIEYTLADDGTMVKKNRITFPMLAKLLKSMPISRVEYKGKSGSGVLNGNIICEKTFPFFKFNEDENSLVIQYDRKDFRLLVNTSKEVKMVVDKKNTVVVTFK